MIGLIVMVGVVAAGSTPPSSLSLIHDDLVRLREALAGLRSYNVRVEVEHFPDATTGGPDFRQVTDLANLDGRVLTRDRERIALFDRDVTIVIDTIRRRILYRRGVAPAAPRSDAAPDRIVSALENALAAGYFFERREVAGGEINIRTEHPDQPIRRTDLYVDRTTHLLSRVVYLYRSLGDEPESRVAIRYEWLDPSTLDARDFLVSTYLHRKDRRLVPRVPYESFELVMLDDE